MRSPRNPVRFKPIPGISLLELCEDALCSVELFFPVVQQNKCKFGFGFGVARVGRGLLDESHRLLLAAVEADEIGHHSNRPRQERDEIPVQAEREVSVLPRRVKLEHLFVLRVRALGIAERAEALALDGGRVRGRKRPRCTELVMDLWVIRHPPNSILR